MRAQAVDMIAPPALPRWMAENCMQCGWCSLACPTGALRLCALPEAEAENAAASLPMKGAPGKRYAVVLSPGICDGCGDCAAMCPAGKKALRMEPAGEARAAVRQEPDGRPPEAGAECFFGPDTVKGSQLRPLPREFFAGSASVYRKLAFQLFGASVLETGADEALAFCDGVRAQRERLGAAVERLREIAGASAQAWLAAPAGGDISGICGVLLKKCGKFKEQNADALFVLKHRRLLEWKGVWIFGGAAAVSGARLPEGDARIRLLLTVTDTEIASAKAIMERKDAFVASVSLYADPEQAVRMIYEAGTYPGTAVILAYMPEGEPEDRIARSREAVRGLRWPLTRRRPGAAAETETVPAYEALGRRHRAALQWEAVNLAEHRNPMPELPLSERVRSFEEIGTGYTASAAIREAMRCLRCRERPCMRKGCPARNRIPDFIGEVAAGNFEEAYRILCETTSLPAVCSRVCQQERQCEGSCVRGRKGQPVAIGNLERFVADWHGRHASSGERPIPAANGRRVAVVGSGPAGIACAGELAARGYSVTMFEKEPAAGGVLTYGIPAFRLPAGIVEGELGRLKESGVRILTDTAVCGALTADDLLGAQGYDAVFLGHGAEIPARMGIPGEELDGVYTASDYLKIANREKARGCAGEPSLPGARRIVVVGGGNVAMDACRCAVRTGAESVRVVYRRSEAEMPADRRELADAREEGVEFRFLTNPVAIRGDEAGRVTGVECVAMSLGAPDASGRNAVTPVEGSGFVLDAELVIMAIGTGFDRQVMDGMAGVETTARGAVLTDGEGATSRPGVFAAGDAVTGPDTVVRAMEGGRAAARRIDEYISALRGSAEA